MGKYAEPNAQSCAGFVVQCVPPFGDMIDKTDNFSASGECAKAEKILRSFLFPKAKKNQDEDTELGIPRAILSRAKASGHLFKNRIEFKAR